MKTIISFLFCVAIGSLARAESLQPGSMGERAAQGQSVKPFGEYNSARDREYLGGISGRCVLKNEDVPTLSIPCPSIAITLENKKGKRLDSTTIMDGRFAFPTVPDNASLFIRVTSPKYKSTKTFGPVRKGETLDITVTKVKE